MVAVGDRPAEQRSVVRRMGLALLNKIEEGLDQAVPGPVDMVGPLAGSGSENDPVNPNPTSSVRLRALP